MPSLIVRRFRSFSYVRRGDNGVLATPHRHPSRASVRERCLLVCTRYCEAGRYRLLIEAAHISKPRVHNLRNWQ